MNNSIDLQILTQTSFDSGSLSGLAAVVHRLDQVGEHRVTVLQTQQGIQTFTLKVMKPQLQRTRTVNEVGTVGTVGRQTASGSPQPSPSASSVVHVDLSSLQGAPGNLAPQGPENMEVYAQGYALFHAPHAQPAIGGGFAVQLHASGAVDQSPVFDSRKLGNADLFTTTLFRPGRYSLRNAELGVQGEIRVSYPVISDTPYHPPDPVDVQVSQDGFQSNFIQLKPAQGLIFHIGNVSARILIDLVEADDGPPDAGQTLGGGRKPLYRWERPGGAPKAN